MSQSNSEEKRKMSGITKVIIFTLVFVLVAAALTFLAIYYTNNKQHQDENNLGDETSQGENIVKKVEDHLKITNQYDTFDHNSLTIKTETANDMLIEKTNFMEYYRINISYPQIEGLKNLEVQNRINATIKEKAFSFMKESYKTDSEIYNITIRASIMGNFGDTLSVYYYFYINYKNKTGVMEEHGMNFQLSNGNPIKFEQLFTNDAPINSIIANAAYKKLSWDKYREKQIGMGGYQLTDDDYAEFEDECMKIVYMFQNDAQHEFYYNPQKIYLKVTGVDGYIAIDMIDCYQNIAIYKRFKNSQELYKDNSIGLKNSYVFTNRSQSTYDMYGKVEENAFVRLVVFTDNNDKSIKILDKIKNKINETIESKKKEFKNNPSKGYAYFMDGFISYDKNKHIIELMLESQNNVMAIDFYKNNIDRKIAEAERKPKASYEVSLISGDDPDRDKITVQNESIRLTFDEDGNIINN